VWKKSLSPNIEETLAVFPPMPLAQKGRKDSGVGLLGEVVLRVEQWDVVSPEKELAQTILCPLR